MKKATKMIIGGIVALGVIGACADTDVEEVKEEEKVVQEQQQQEQSQVVEEQQPVVEEKQEPQLTLGQKNAIKTAESYLSFTAFSRKGLIGQLEFEGYSTEEATFAVDHVTVNWNEQCARVARSYLEFTAFSRQGLHDQLEYEGFTEEQIQYGLQAVGY